jgi:hypothetical protein
MDLYNNMTSDKLINMNYEELLMTVNGSKVDDIQICKAKVGICESCNIEQEIIQCYYVCPKCCAMDLEPLFYDIPFEMEQVVKRSFYKRRLYCIEKLNYITGRNEPTTVLYRNMIQFLKQKKFSNIKQLKTLMRTYGYNKYYKHIYNVFFSIKNIRLINLKPMDIYKISLEFVKMDVNFKMTQHDHKRKNFMAYNSIIYLVLKQMKIRGYKHILKPNNHIELVTNVYNKYLTPDVV